ncbi:unnamed protein product, partial [Protopolystoma xenopodis]
MLSSAETTGLCPFSSHSFALVTCSFFRPLPPHPASNPVSNSAPASLRHEAFQWLPDGFFCPHHDRPPADAVSCQHYRLASPGLELERLPTRAWRCQTPDGQTAACSRCPALPRAPETRFPRAHTDEVRCCRSAATQPRPRPRPRPQTRPRPRPRPRPQPKPQPWTIGPVPVPRGCGTPSHASSCVSTDRRRTDTPGVRRCGRRSAS